jgi:uncharacterized lipoprotein YddW (UPF0748 family)
VVRAVRWLCAVLLAIGSPGGAVAAAAQPAPDWSLGVWLTTVDSRVMLDQRELVTGLRLLAGQGIRRVAVPLYTGGYVYWPVPNGRNRLSIGTDPRVPDPNAIAATFAAVRAMGMESVGWFEFGLMAPADAAWLRGREDLLLRNRAGRTEWAESPGLTRVWLNPARSEVREALSDLVIDACSRYHLDVVQFDDHLGYPADFGYDELTLGSWRKTAYGALEPLPASADRRWITWRSQWITSLLAEISQRVRRECPHTRISASPNPLEFSQNNYLADWSVWVERQLIDELVVQVYRRDMPSFLRELNDPAVLWARRRLPVRIGVLAGLRNQLQSPDLLAAQVREAQSLGFQGVDVFFFETLREQWRQGLRLEPAAGAGNTAASP